MSPDDLHLDDDPGEPGAIGVGMGGSCPTCRAPVDLGQEFCLECGAPIRFTPRQRSRKRSRSAAPAAAAPAPKRSGFPWIPFLVVLALVAGGVALTLVDQGDSKKDSGSKSNSDSTVPTITNTPPTTTTDSSTITTTLQDCDPAQPLGGTQPAVSSDTSGGTSTDPVTGESIPSLDTSGTSGTSTDGSTDPFGVPSTTPTDGSSSDGSQPTVTVDQNGNLCADAGTSGTTTDPATGTPTTPGTDTTSTTDTTAPDTSGTWPANKDGWTVIVAGYDTQARADSRATQVQGDGFADSGVLFSTDFQSLCPGIYVVFSGTFATESEANARLKELQAKPDYAGMYVREVKRSGTRPSNCTAAK